jgi:hypothetical protein
MDGSLKLITSALTGGPDLHFFDNYQWKQFWRAESTRRACWLSLLTEAIW